MKIFNRVIPATVLALIVIAGLGSAALVGYISNTVTADIEVSSPMRTGISLGFESWGGDSYPQDSHTLDDWETENSLSIPDIKGSGTVTLYTMSENLADVDIEGFEEAIVTNLDEVTCGDFESVKVRTDSIYGDLGYGTQHELIPDGCFVVDDYHVQFGSPGNSLWNVTETDVTEIVVTFKTDASGTYTFTYRVIPAVV